MSVRLSEAKKAVAKAATVMLTSRVTSFILGGILVPVAVNVTTMYIQKQSFDNGHDTTAFKADYDKEHKGQREWHKINDNIWIELYPDSADNKVSLLRKIRHEKYSSCKGIVVQKVAIGTVDGEEHVYNYTCRSPKQELFIPNDLSRMDKILAKQGWPSRWVQLLDAY